MSNSTNKRTAGTRHISHHRTTSDAARLASCLTSIPRARGLVADGSVKPWRRSSRRLLLRRRPRVLLSQRKTCSPCASAAAAQTLPRPAELAHALLTSGFCNGFGPCPSPCLFRRCRSSSLCTTFTSVRAVSKSAIASCTRNPFVSWQFFLSWRSSCSPFYLQEARIHAISRAQHALGTSVAFRPVGSTSGLVLLSYCPSPLILAAALAPQPQPPPPPEPPPYPPHPRRTPPPLLPLLLLLQ